VSRYQKGKTNLDFTEALTGSGISWAIRKSAPRSRQITTPAPHHTVFTGWMPFLPPNQQKLGMRFLQARSPPCLCHRINSVRAWKKSHGTDISNSEATGLILSEST